MIAIAIGTITPVKGASYVSGNKRVRVYDVQVTAGANYTTGGESLTPASFGLKSRIDSVHFSGGGKNAAGTAQIGLAINYVSGQSVKLQAYSSGTEQSANADLSTYTARLTVTGA